MSMIPRAFIGSSSESLTAAKALKTHLQDVADVRLWAEDVFHASDYTLDALIREAGSSDIAILLFTPDDLSAIRKSLSDTVRDNVVFEYGLFLGRLGRIRCYFVMPQRSPDLHIPSDLAGVTAITYKPDVFKVDQAAAFRDVADRLRTLIESSVSGGSERRSLSGRWLQCWNVTGSANYPEQNRSDAEVVHIGTHVRAQWRSESDAFVFDGQFDGRLITGTWRSQLEGAGYVGAFQLYVAANARTMQGRWVGHREAMNQIDAGAWRWERKE